MQKEPTHIRRGKTIITVETKAIDQLDSINQAKKRSRELRKTGAVVRAEASEIKRSVRRVSHV